MPDTPGARRPNRRLLARTTCHLTVRYRWKGDWRPATAMDLSRHGCRLRVGEDLAREVVVHLHFEARTADAPPPVEMEGHVMWCRVEGLSFQAGIQFHDAPADLEARVAELCAGALHH